MSRERAGGWSRDLPVEAKHAALLIIDVQNYICRRESRAFAGLSDEEFEARHGEFFANFHGDTVKNLQSLVHGFRDASAEVVFSTIESQTRDGRDRSLDYKISGFNVPKGAWEGEVIDDISPLPDEIIFKKTSSSVFISTNIDYVLRNIGIRQIVIAGIFTDQCVESAIRDAADLGYLVTQVSDACAAQSMQSHERSLVSVSGYCRQVNTQTILRELDAHRAAND